MINLYKSICKYSLPISHRHSNIISLPKNTDYKNYKQTFHNLKHYCIISKNKKNVFSGPKTCFYVILVHFIINPRQPDLEFKYRLGSVRSHFQHFRLHKGISGFRSAEFDATGFTNYQIENYISHRRCHI